MNIECPTCGCSISLFIHDKRDKILQEREKARRTTRIEIAIGRLIKQPCEICGDVETEAHHEDYSKPLNIKWLCREHHMKLHNKRPRIESELVISVATPSKHKQRRGAVGKLMSILIDNKDTELTTKGLCEKAGGNYNTNRRALERLANEDEGISRRKQGREVYWRIIETDTACATLCK